MRHAFFRTVPLTILVTALAACQATAADGAKKDEAASTETGTEPSSDSEATAPTDRTSAATSSNDEGSAVESAPPATCKTDLAPFIASLKVPGISGSIVKNGRVVCTAVAGVANTKTKQPVTADTGFLWASVSKTVTAAAAMQLFEQGKLALDDDINKYLGFNARVPKCTSKPITFRQLLTHTSSIKDNDDIIDSSPVAVESGDPTVPLADLVKGYLTTDGEFFKASGNFHTSCPGTVSDYSNIGITTLGYLVQAISGQDLYSYFHDHIFAPLGMTNSSFRLADLDVSQVAMPDGNTPHYGEADYPDGMMRTSPHQLGKFLAMIMSGGTYEGHQILQPSTIAEMLKKQTSLDPASTGGITQGLAFYTVNTFGPITWGHDGDDDGATSNMFFDPETKTGVILVSNGTWSGDPGAVPAMKALFAEAASF